MPVDKAPDPWESCIASTLAWHLDRLDKAIFHYPRELQCAGEVRMAIAKTIRELKEHADL